jgi:TetR/AcrR family transcriptional regulator, transcriptional repressor for nem operon
MKRSKAETAETRRRIVEIASESFRTQGIEATGVAGIMAAAGLTHGAFYRHFESKDELVAEAVAMGLEQLILESEQWAGQGAEGALRHALDYLSAETRHVASEAFKRNLEILAPFMATQQSGDRSAAAISILTNMIGALTMSRMVDDPKLSERILEVTRERLVKAMQVKRSSTSPISNNPRSFP